MRPLDPVGLAVCAVLALLLAAVAAGPLIWTVDPEHTQLANKFAMPSADAPWGTDEFGRDLLSRLLHGGRLSLFGTLLVVVGCSGLGLLVGITASLVGGWPDALLSRCVVGLLTLPALVVALAIAGVLGKSFGHVLLALVMTEWPWYARLYRALFVSELHRPYVLAARALGASSRQIALKHVLRNVAGPALVLASTNLRAAILSLTALSFLGLACNRRRRSGALWSTAGACSFRPHRG